MTPTYLRATLNKTLFESKRFQARFFCPSSQDKRTKSVPRRRGHHDSPPTYEQKCISLPIASFANPAAQTEPLSDTSVCRQLHHCRLLLLEFPLQMTIVPRVSDDSRARIRETSLSFSMKTSCLPCDVPSGRVVHPALVYVTRRIMSVDFEWRFGPYSRFPSQLAHHKTAADVAYPRQLATQGSKLG